MSDGESDTRDLQATGARFSDRKPAVLPGVSGGCFLHPECLAQRCEAWSCGIPYLESRRCCFDCSDFLCLAPFFRPACHLVCESSESHIFDKKKRATCSPLIMLSLQSHSFGFLPSNFLGAVRGVFSHAVCTGWAALLPGPIRAYEHPSLERRT